MKRICTALALTLATVLASTPPANAGAAYADSSAAQSASVQALGSWHYWDTYDNYFLCSWAGYRLFTAAGIPNECRASGSRWALFYFI
jgi:hypothetical protein